MFAIRCGYHFSPPLDILQLDASLGTLARRPIHVYLPVMLWHRLLILHLLKYHLPVVIFLKGGSTFAPAEIEFEVKFNVWFAPSLGLEPSYFLLGNQKKASYHMLNELGVCQKAKTRLPPQNRIHIPNVICDVNGNRTQYQQA